MEMKTIIPIFRNLENGLKKAVNSRHWTLWRVTRLHYTTLATTLQNTELLSQTGRDLTWFEVLGITARSCHSLINDLLPKGQAQLLVVLGGKS